MLRSKKKHYKNHIYQNLFCISNTKEAHEKAKQLITGHLDVMHRAADFLIERETITGEEFMKIVEGCQKQQA